MVVSGKIRASRSASEATNLAHWLLAADLPVVGQISSISRAATSLAGVKTGKIVCAKTRVS
jgi:hypothetical protein